MDTAQLAAETDVSVGRQIVVLHEVGRGNSSQGKAGWGQQRLLQGLETFAAGMAGLGL